MRASSYRALILITSLAFSPCDATLASASFDGTIKLWGPLKPERAIRRLRPAGFHAHSLYVSGDLAVSADCHWLALRDSPDRVVVVDIEDDNREVCNIPVPPDAMTAISFPENGQQDVLNIAQDGGRLLQWNVNENRLCWAAYDATVISA